jgi:aminomethyltransferase
MAQQVLQPFTDVDLEPIEVLPLRERLGRGVPGVTVSRTGYTGEDGFELYFPNAHATTIWKALTSDGRVTPAGLGARDSLRLEMGMALYGNDIDDTVTPLRGQSWPGSSSCPRATSRGAMCSSGRKPRA